MENIDTEIKLIKNQETTIELESNPTTGYRWAIVDNDNIEIKQNYVPDQPIITGSGGKDIFNIKKLEYGIGSLRIEYKRNSDNSQAEHTAIYKFID